MPDSVPGPDNYREESWFSAGWKVGVNQMLKMIMKSKTSGIRANYNCKWSVYNIEKQYTERKYIAACLHQFCTWLLAKTVQHAAKTWMGVPECKNDATPHSKMHSRGFSMTSYLQDENNHHSNHYNYLGWLLMLPLRLNLSVVIYFVQTLWGLSDGCYYP